MMLCVLVVIEVAKPLEKARNPGVQISVLLLTGKAGQARSPWSCCLPVYDGNRLLLPVEEGLCRKNCVPAPMIGADTGGGSFVLEPFLF